MFVCSMWSEIQILFKYYLYSGQVHWPNIKIPLMNYWNYQGQNDNTLLNPSYPKRNNSSWLVSHFFGSWFDLTGNLLEEIHLRSDLFSKLFFMFSKYRFPITIANRNFTLALRSKKKELNHWVVDNSLCQRKWKDGETKFQARLAINC